MSVRQKTILVDDEPGIVLSIATNLEDAGYAVMTTGNMPILMLSAHPNAEQEARTAGADGFVAKPFDLDNLLAKAASYV